MPLPFVVLLQGTIVCVTMQKRRIIRALRCLHLGKVVNGSFGV